MSLSKWVLVGIVAAVTLGGLGLFYPKAQTIVDAAKVDVNAIAQAVLEQVRSENPTVGASSGPDSFFDCEAHNGIRRCFTRVGMIASSSVACIVKAPSATSTLTNFSVRINSNGLGAQTFDVGTTTAALGVSGATTSPVFIASASIGATSQGDYFWNGGSIATTSAVHAARVLSHDDFTAGTGLSSFMVRPGEVITAKIATTSTTVSGTFATYLGGFCQATFELN